MSEEMHESQDQEFEPQLSEVEQPFSEVEQESKEEVVDVKQKAKSTGHLTQEEYLAKHGSLKGYKTEEEFVRTGDMIEQIYSLKKMLSKRESEVEAILNYNRSTIEEQKKRFRQELDTKLAQAREYGNIEAVEALVKQQTQLDYQEQQESLKNQLSQQQQAAQEFVERNKHWYNEAHPEAVQRANQIDQELTAYYNRVGKSVPLSQLALEVEAQMRREFPDLVNTGVSARPALSSTKSSVNKTSPAMEESEDRMYSKLNQDQKLMYQAEKRMLTKAGYNYSIKDFVKRMKEDGEI